MLFEESFQYVTEFTLPNGVKIVRRQLEKDSWAVVRDGFVLYDVEGEDTPASLVVLEHYAFVYEPMSSSRDEEFLKRARFTLSKAFELAERIEL